MVHAMAILVDSLRTYDPINNGGNSTQPPGISGNTWCHCVATDSLVELETFLTLFFATVEQPPTSIRTPLLGSNLTYVGFDQNMRDAAVAAGADEVGRIYCLSHSFDSSDDAGTYEP